MGRVLDIGVEVAYKHEGYAAWVLDDGTLTGTANVETDRRKTGRLRAVCECGWTGPEEFDVDSDDPADWPSDELEDEILADWEAHVRRLVVAEQRRDLDTLVRVLRGFGRNADDLEAAERGNLPNETTADVLGRTRGNLTYAAELIGRLTTEED